jgi:hypothetical protein
VVDVEDEDDPGDDNANDDDEVDGVAAAVAFRAVASTRCCSRARATTLASSFSSRRDVLPPRSVPSGELARGRFVPYHITCDGRRRHSQEMKNEKEEQEGRKRE